MRKLVAALACRVQGSRLYGKPLQHLDIENRITIIEHIILALKQLPEISEIVLGIAEGRENSPFVDIANKHQVKHIWGSEKDVLQRLIDCCQHVDGTDVFRVTTECPFIYFDAVSRAWKTHIEQGNDVTVIDGLPEGCFFEIFSLETLLASHRLGEDADRSELCSRYVVKHREQFKVEILAPPANLCRLDLRLTVDYPEDLYVCRRVYAALKQHAPLIPVSEVIRFLDANPDVTKWVEPYVHPVKVWE